MAKLFPATVIILYLGAVVCYAWQGNYKQSVYSLLAASLNVIVYFWE